MSTPQPPRRCRGLRRASALLLISLLWLQSIVPPGLAASASHRASDPRFNAGVARPAEISPEGASAAGAPAAQSSGYGVVLTPLTTAFHAHLGLDFHPPTGKLLVSAHTPTGLPHNFELIDAAGAHHPFTNITGLAGEVTFVVARDEAQGLSRGGFRAGETLASSGTPGHISRITPDGAAVQPAWVVLPGEAGAVADLHLDRSGVFGGDLLAVTSSGALWRVSAAGAAAKVADLGAPLASVVALENDPDRYGPWAGKAIVGAAASGLLHAVDAQGSSAPFDLGLHARDLAVVAAHENFYGTDTAGQRLWGAPAAAFGGMIGDLLIAQRSPASLVRVRWTGSQMEASQVSEAGGGWAKIAFAPAGVAEVPPVKQYYSRIAVVRRAPVLDSGRVEGALWQLTGEAVTLDGTDTITDELLVPGTPAVTVSGSPDFGGVTQGIEGTTPSGYAVSIGGRAKLRSLVTRTDPAQMPGAPSVPSAAGTRDLTLSQAGQGAGDFATLRDLTLSGNNVTVAVPPGTYGRFAASGKTSLVLGVEGAAGPSVYNLRGLSLAGGSVLQVVGPVVLNVKEGVTLAGSTVGAPEDPKRLGLWVEAGGVTLGGTSVLYGVVRAPQGEVSVSGKARLRGSSYSDRLSVSGGGVLQVTENVVPPPAVNRAPMAEAGPDQTITLPADTVSLVGAVGDDGLPAGAALTAAWSRVSGPGAVVFGDAQSAATTASFTQPGQYVLRLTASDTLLTTSDTVTVTVIPHNQPPAVSAGADSSVKFPAPAPLGGIVTDDGLPRGAVVSIVWSKVSGPGAVTFADPSVAQTSASFSAPGLYLLRLSASDSEFTSADEVSITVLPANVAPAVSAGPDGAVTLPAAASLSGSVSDDGYPAGAALTALWEKVSGPGAVTFADASAPATTATFAAPGEYVLRLSASDTEFTSADEVSVTVTAPPNRPPVVNAGADQSVAFPALVRLGGTASDDGLPFGSTLTVKWSVKSGPGAVSFAHDGQAATTASFNSAGVYTLELRASDGEAAAADEVKITVGAQFNYPPTVDAGPDQQLPEGATAALAGAAADDGKPSGSTLAYQWSKLSGPGEVSFSNAAAPQTAASFSAPGAYVLRLTASDGQFPASDTLVITLGEAENRPPVIHAGADALLSELCGSTDFMGGDGLLTLEGRADDDGLPVGGQLTVKWTLVEGPVLANNNEAWVDFWDTGLLTRLTTHGQGVYLLRLTVSDGEHTVTDEVVVTSVQQHCSLNKPPTALAGPDKAVLGLAAALTGSAVDDALPAGRVLFTQWSLVSGPGSVSFADPNAAQTTAQFSAPGRYVLRLSASDGQFSDADDVVVVAAPCGGEPGAVQGYDVVVVVDHSSSLDTRQAAVLLALNRVVDSLELERDQVGVVTFNPVATLISELTHDGAAVKARGLLGLPFDKGTNGGAGIQMARDMLAGPRRDPANKPVIVYITDGKDMNPQYVRDQAASARAEGVRFIALDTDGYDELFALASTPEDWHGGSLFIATTAAEWDQGQPAKYFPTNFWEGLDRVMGSLRDAAVACGSEVYPLQVFAAPDYQRVDQDRAAALYGWAWGPAETSVYQWGQVSGPGAATFSAPGATQTAATFPTVGRYRLRLEASQPGFSNTADAWVDIYEAPPVVSAGPDQLIESGRGLRLDGGAASDGLPAGMSLATLWEQVEGPGAATLASPTEVSTEVSFPGPGRYRLRLSATDPDTGVTASDEVVVEVLPAYELAGEAARGNVGTDFWLAFPLSSLARQSGNYQLKVLITGEAATSGQVSSPALAAPINFTVTPGQVTAVALPPGLLSTELYDAVEGKGIRVRAQQPVSVYGLHRREKAGEGYLAIPAHSLGTDYVVMARSNLGYSNDNTEVAGSQFVVVATLDATTLTITPSGQVTTTIAGCCPLPQRPAGVPYAVTLNRGQTYVLNTSNNSKTDLTGTAVTSNKPVAVIGGHRGADTGSHVLEQVPPVRDWGRRHFLVPVSDIPAARQSVRVLASEDATTVGVNDVRRGLINRGQYFEVALAGPTSVVSDKPVLVAHLTDPVSNNKTMAVVPPAEGYGTDYLVTSAPEQGARHYLNVVVPEDGVGGVTVDGAAVAASSFAPIGRSGYWGAALAVAEGAHRVRGTRPLGVTAHGGVTNWNYAYTGAVSYATLGAGARLDLTPARKTWLLGQQACAAASVTDAAGAGLGGILVSFNVAGVNPSGGAARTGADGRAQYCYAGAAAGEDTLTASAGGLSATAAWRWADHNTAPVVSAGADFTAYQSEATALRGEVSDDGLPTEAVAATWSKVSGPGEVGFADPSSPTSGVTFESEGSYVLRLSASDTELSGADEVAVTVKATRPPLAGRILSPSDGGVVTTRTPVVGTVGEGAVAWRLEYAADGDPADVNSSGADDRVWTQLGAGVGPVEAGALGSFDPTLLLNGVYEIRLLIFDGNGDGVVASTSVAVEGGQKVGNFTVSFLDLEVSVGRLPLTVTRSYDSRDRRVGDFGAGWSLGINSARLYKTAPLGRHWRQTVGGSIIPVYCLEASRPHLVVVAMPGGEVYKFEAQPVDRCRSAVAFQYADLRYVPLAGTVGALEAVDGGEEPEAAVRGEAPPGEVLLFENNEFGQLYNPTTFRLTTEDGTVIEIDQRRGVRKVTDLNGNSISIGAGGITHSAGKSVTFTRDSQGRITSITDPNGKSLAYGYDGRGDLVSFTDRENNTTTYGYGDDHRLLSVRDPRGVELLRNYYDAAGRLLRQADAAGKELSYGHDLAAWKETVTDRLGNRTELSYDERGNVIRRVDALGGVSTATYDGEDNLLSETDAAGRTMSYSYDGRGNRLTATDPLGGTTRYSYDGLNRVLTVTDPLGRVTTNTYDARGNLTSVKDAAGKTETMEYTASGLVSRHVDEAGNATTYEYDAFGNLVREIKPPLAGASSGMVITHTYDANGKQIGSRSQRTTAAGSTEEIVTSFQVDPSGRVTKFIDPSGATREVSYNSLGQPSAMLDKLGRRTTYEYDQMGRQFRTVFPDGTREEVEYDVEGRPVKRTGRGGRTVISTYDGLGRVVKETLPGGASATVTYNAVGQPLVKTDVLGNSMRYEYDGAGRVTKVTDALDNVTTYTYDAAGDCIAVTDPKGRTTRYEYDLLGRTTKIIFADGTSQGVTYDALGRVTSRKDQSDRVTSFTYDSQGHLTSVTDALGKVTSYGYDEVGNKISQTDALGRVTRFEYDRMHRRTKRTLPLGSSETYSYDAAGRLMSLTDLNGKTTTYSYNGADRLATKTPDPSLGQPAVRFTYGADGRRATMVDASGTTTYTYDALGRLTSKATPQGTLSYTYDTAGNLLGTASSNTDGVNVSYGYDRLNRLTAVTDNRLTAGTTLYTYDTNGNTESMLYPNGVRTAYSYDQLNRLTNLNVTDTAATTIAGYAYTLAPTGIRNSVVEHDGRTVAYTYDALYRLTRETVSGDPATNNGTVSYTYDDVGNRTSRASTLAAVPSGNYVYDGNDRLASDTYDDNGNTLSVGGVTYRFDFENRLSEAGDGAVKNIYDGDGHRVSKTVGGVTTKYLVDTHNLTGYAQVVEELRGGSVVRAYTYGSDLISQRQLIAGQWETSFYGYDGHGNVRLLTDDAGAVTDTYDYDAFGVLIARTGSTPNDYLYSGEQRDPHLGLDYLRARYMNPDTGRFMTMDSFEGHTHDPRSLHKYLYAAADPVNHLDPSGHFSLPEVNVSGLIKNGLATLRHAWNFSKYEELETAIRIAGALLIVSNGLLQYSHNSARREVSASFQVNFNLWEVSKEIIPDISLTFSPGKTEIEFETPFAYSSFTWDAETGKWSFEDVGTKLPLFTKQVGAFAELEVYFSPYYSGGQRLSFALGFELSSIFAKENEKLGLGYYAETRAFHLNLACATADYSIDPRTGRKIPNPPKPQICQEEGIFSFDLF